MPLAFDSWKLATNFMSRGVALQHAPWLSWGAATNFMSRGEIKSWSAFFFRAGFLRAGRFWHHPAIGRGHDSGKAQSLCNMLLGFSEGGSQLYVQGSEIKSWSAFFFRAAFLRVPSGVRLNHGQRFPEGPEGEGSRLVSLPVEGGREFGLIWPTRPKIVENVRPGAFSGSFASEAS